MPNLPSDYGQQEAYYASDAYRSSLNKDGIGTTYETVKKREQIEKNREEGYRDTGGLPANLRYPYAMIDSGMDFLKIQIATYTPPDVEIEGLLDVPETTDTTGANLKTGDIKLSDDGRKQGAFAPVSYTHLTLPTNREV